MWGIIISWLFLVDILASDQNEQNSKNACALGELLSGSLASLEERVVTAAATSNKTTGQDFLASSPPTILSPETPEPSDKKNLPNSESTTSDNNTQTCASQHVCVKLCSLILTQLVKAHTEVIRR